jgi:hypothetical protein
VGLILSGVKAYKKEKKFRSPEKLTGGRIIDASD